MRLRNIPTARTELEECPFVLDADAARKLRGRWAEEFRRRAGVSAPSDISGLSSQYPGKRELHIEIGMGKGRFLMELARKHPETDYIGIEQYSSVLVHAARKMNALADAGDCPGNLLLIRMNAELLPDIFAPSEVDRIYLNFSDPWPKDRHAKRRLPGRVYLSRFAAVLSPDGSLEFKTDNRPLFDFALEESAAAGWHLDRVTYDLHSDPVMRCGNVMTEYEERFSAMGNPIFKLVEYP